MLEVENVLFSTGFSLNWLHYLFDITQKPIVCKMKKKIWLQEMTVFVSFCAVV